MFTCFNSLEFLHYSLLISPYPVSFFEEKYNENKQLLISVTSFLNFILFLFLFQSFAMPWFMIMTCVIISAKCQPGLYSLSGLEPCSACPVGFFATKTGSQFCLECPWNLTTLSTGSSSYAQCLGEWQVLLYLCSFLSFYNAFWYLKMLYMSISF